MAQNPIGNFIFIRGIGSSTNQGIEQSVSIFHDGIYMGRHQLSRAPFMDLERVEVVRGPQSSMHGKNTSEMYTEEIVLHEPVAVGEKFQLEATLVGGSMFKIMGLAVCS